MANAEREAIQSTGHVPVQSGYAAETVRRHFILGTAGHIDHGKSSLVRALTGTDPDRLPEEKRRGMTIELGFADLTIGDTRFGIVDVPGHEKFVRTMVAGATGIDLALLVVAADDSVMPQTVEHVEVLRLLGVEHMVVAVTKIDMVDRTMVELVVDEIRELLSSGVGRFGQAPAKSRFGESDSGRPPFPTICPVSSITGEGMDELRRVLYDTSRIIKIEDPPVPFRMAVDRVFTVAGRGTVVTGSVLRGQVQAGDTLEVFSPGGKSGSFPGGGKAGALPTCRVRELQTHGAAESVLRRGQRAALNLSGIDREQLARGAELATPGYLQPSNLLDVRLEALSPGMNAGARGKAGTWKSPNVETVKGLGTGAASAEGGLKSAQTVRLEIGTAELPVRAILLEGDAVPPGGSGYAQLRSGEPIAAVYGQRFILRDETASRTIGGGVVLRPMAKRRRLQVRHEPNKATGHESAKGGKTAELSILESGRPLERVAEVLRAAGFERLTDLQICARAGVSLEGIPALLSDLQAAGRWGAVAGTAGTARLSSASPLFATPEAVEDLFGRLVAWLERYHQSHPELPGRPVDSVLGWIERVTGHKALARPLFEQWVGGGKLKQLGRFACSPAFAPSLSPADERILSAMCEEIRLGGFSPPALDELSISKQADRKRTARLATLAVAMGEIVSIDSTLYLHAESEAKLRQIVADLIAARGGVSVSEIREALGSSRKFVVPFLEYLDRAGFTRRAGDRRELVEGRASAEKHDRIQE